MTAAEAFGYSVLLCDNFDGVLGGMGEPVLLRDLVGLALRKGRVLLQAPGGAGKTWTLSGLQREAERQGHRSSYVEVQSIDVEQLTTNGVEALLRAATPELGYEQLAGDRKLLLLVDGLSEVSSQTAELVLRAVDQWAALGPHTGTVVADRLVRRSVRELRWQLATLSPIPADNIESVLGREVSEDERPLLQLPAYLLAARGVGGRPLLGRGDAIEQLLAQLSSDRELLAEVEEFALDVYVELKQRSFPTERLAQMKASVADALTAAGIVTEIGNRRSTFIHHLIHDYLAASAASRCPERWDHELFDALSLHSSSNDSLLFLFEKVAEEFRDNLIRRVYDWNLYAASYLLSKTTSHGGARQSTEYEILALLGERRFDHFQATRRQVEDALVLHGGEMAAAYLRADSVDAVLAIAKQAEGRNAEFDEWLTLYLCDQSPATKWLVDKMTETDGVDGWTAANVVRRLGFDDATQQQVMDLCTHNSHVVRWRAVHALGVASKGAREFLFERLREDPESSVRYGALRSIVDQAYLGQVATDRADTFRMLAEEVEEVLASKSLSRELARTLEVVDPPSDWADSIGPMLERIMQVESDSEQLDRWRLVAAGVRLARVSS
jgi:hypothetical protein